MPLGPVRPLEDYVGSYAHPGYGTLTIGSVPDGLVGSCPGLAQGRFEHRHLEVFDLVLSIAGEEQRLPAQFSHDLHGDVDGVRILLEPAVPPIAFARQVDTAHLADDLLRALVGEYTMGPVSIVVSRRGGRELVASIAGQTAQLLRLVHDRTFEVEGARLEFADDGRLVTPMGDFRRS